MTTIRLVIEGSRIQDIPSFYDEINRLFMADEDWKLGPSLDALDDLLYGGYGALHAAEAATITWRQSDTSRKALGRETTRQYYLAKLDQPDIFDSALTQKALDTLNQGHGPTYFEIILEIIADHANISLELA